MASELDIQLHLPSPITEIKLFNSHNIHVKRDDLIHETISGNKWRKLKYNIQKAVSSGCDTLITFGGAYSNHIAAVAQAAQLAGLKSVGIIRGEHVDVTNSTLGGAQLCGMHLIPVPVEEYNQRNNYHYHDQLRLEYPTGFIIPEGGCNYEGIMGSMEIVKELPTEYDYICCAIGTGTTLAGLVLSKPASTHILGFSVFKSTNGVKQMVMNNLSQVINNAEVLHEYENDFTIVDGYGFGGYGKINDELKQFAKEIYQKHQLPLDLVYTAKAFYGLIQQIELGKIASSSKILFYHSGGLQGNRGFGFYVGD